MNANELNRTVGEYVAERASRSRVFERRGIDFCCGGKIPLGEACRQKNLDPLAILDEIAAADRAGESDQHGDWGSASMEELVDHILAAHHEYLRRELPRLDALTAKVAQVHGARHPELINVRGLFLQLKEEIEAHLMKEEQVLFPLIRRIASGEAGGFHCGSIANPIRVMEMEHEGAGAAMDGWRQLTHNYTAPDDACNTYRAMLAGLAELEQDMHHHVHEENNILFPRAIAAEREAMSACAR